MTSAREDILQRVRAARPAHQPDPVPREYDRHREAADPPALFAERAGDYEAQVHRVANTDLSDAITATLQERGVTAMTAPGDLLRAWRSCGVTWWPDEVHAPLSTHQVDATDGVLTGCAVAIAETGTIVLDGGPAQGRRMLSLIPDYHLCVVRAEQIVTAVPAALARLDPLNPLTFISGPSATSDIELDRVTGVHGPRTLDVLVVS